MRLIIFDDAWRIPASNDHYGGDGQRAKRHNYFIYEDLKMRLARNAVFAVGTKCKQDTTFLYINSKRNISPFWRCQAL